MALYIITDGNKNYIRRDINGKYVPVKSRALADEFEEKWKAKKVLDNNLNPKTRKGFYISEEETGILNTIKEENNKSPCIIESNIKTDFCNDNFSELKNKILEIKKFIDENESRKLELTELLSITDKEITDIQHFIEFSDLDDVEILKIYHMLKARLKNRRNIKNELVVLRQLSECKMEKDILGDVLTTISEFDNKKYAPRVLTELFNQNIK